ARFDVNIPHVSQRGELIQVVEKIKEKRNHVSRKFRREQKAYGKRNQNGQLRVQIGKWGDGSVDVTRCESQSTGIGRGPLNTGPVSGQQQSGGRLIVVLQRCGKGIKERPGGIGFVRG